MFVPVQVLQQSGKVIMRSVWHSTMFIGIIDSSQVSSLCVYLGVVTRLRSIKPMHQPLLLPLLPPRTRTPNIPPTLGNIPSNHIISTPSSIIADSPLECLQHRLNPTNTHSLQLRLHLRIRHLPMINHRRPAPVAVSRGRPADLRCELGLEVGGEDYGGVGGGVGGVDGVDFLPAGHDVGVVGGDDEEGVDAFVFEVGDVFDVAGDVVSGAGWGEGTWNGDEDDLLVGKLLAGIVGDWETADLGVGRGPGDVLELDALRELLAGLESRHLACLLVM